MWLFSVQTKLIYYLHKLIFINSKTKTLFYKKRFKFNKKLFHKRKFYVYCILMTEKYIVLV